MFGYKIIGLIVVSAIINSSANLLIKLGARKIHAQKSIYEIFEVIFLNLPLLTGLLFFGLSFILYAYILSKVNLNIAYPILTSICFVMVNLGAFIFFGEKFSIMHIVGLIVIILGIWIISLGN